MQVRLTTTAAFVASLFVPFAAQAYDYTAPVPLHAVASFDPTAGVVPFPNNLLLSGTTDLTLNIPIAPDDPAAGPKSAMNALDGFSTTAPWTTTFSQSIDASTLVPGDSVRVFQVNLSGIGGGVAGVVRELAFPTDYVVALAPSDPNGGTLAIVPTKPLQQGTSYMAAITNGVKATSGESVRPSFIYALAERTTPLCTGGQSTVAFLTAANACQLEPLRQLTNAQEAALASQGVDPSTIVLSWVATTQYITPPLLAIESVVEQSPPASTVLAPTGKTLANLGVGLPGVADIYVGAISVPYYLTAPDASAPAPGDCSVDADGATPCPPLTAHWNAAPGGYVPPFDQAGLDPTSTNVTVANPLPVATSTQTVPLLLTVPNAQSGKTKPASGWPVVIFQHGITRNRTDMFAIAGTLAAQGFAVVAIDLPLHGIVDTTNPFYIGNTPLAALGARERTFDIDLQNNTTGAAGPDGVIDSSGSYFINLTNLLTSRDNLRQGVSDLLQLSHAIGSFHITAGNDFDGSKISFLGQSLGAIVGTTFMAIDPNVETAVLNVPGGGIAHLIEASGAFGPIIRAGLAQAGLTPGTAAYDSFFVAAQTVIDAGDPINFASPLNGTQIGGKHLLLQEVVGSGDIPSDQVIPNRVDGAPLSGTEPLIEALGLSDITGTVQSADGIRGAVRFLQGEHGSILDPTDFPAATVEMQGEAASMLASGGTAVVVRNPAIIVGGQ